MCEHDTSCLPPPPSADPLFLDEKARDSLLVGTTGGGYLGFGSGRPPGVPVAPPPDVCVSYVKISGSGAGSQNARALGVRVGDRLVAVTSRSLGPTPDARDAAIDLAAGRGERGAQCHPLAALRWRRGVGGAALTKVSSRMTECARACVCRWMEAVVKLFSCMKRLFIVKRIAISSGLSLISVPHVYVYEFAALWQ